MKHLEVKFNGRHFEVCLNNRTHKLNPKEYAEFILNQDKVAEEWARKTLSQEGVKEVEAKIVEMEKGE